LQIAHPNFPDTFRDTAFFEHRRRRTEAFSTAETWRRSPGFSDAASLCLCGFCARVIARGGPASFFTKTIPSGNLRIAQRV
jgi:hypothetical protein